MNAVHMAQRMTADEYLAIPYDGTRTELVGGEVIVTQPTLRHQNITVILVAALRAWATAATGRGLASAPIDVKLDERDVFAPDVMWYSERRKPPLDEGRPYPVPDIAVEVRSPSTWSYDLGAKWFAYERAGLAELWLVDTAARTIIVCRRASSTARTFDVLLEVGEGEQLTSPQLPGFALDVASLFAG
jgi:Uma2 family endonuclease